MTKSLYIVKLKDPKTDEVMNRLARSVTIVRELPRLKRTVVIEADEATVEVLRKRTWIERIDADEIVSGGGTITVNPGGVSTGGNWAQLRVASRRCPWNLLPLTLPYTGTYSTDQDGTGVDVYVLDSGILTTLSAEFGSPTRAVNVSEVISSGGDGDDHGHGTAVAALAGGAVSGIAPGCNLRSVKVLNSNNGGSTSSIVSGLNDILDDYNLRSNPAVCNISIVGGGSSVDAPIGDLIDAGIPVVVCAGNGYQDLGNYNQRPAESDPDNIIAGGTNWEDRVYRTGINRSGTNYGEEIDICAPAEKIRLPDLDTGHKRWNGTSFAAPAIVGAMAILLQKHVKMTTRTQVQAAKQTLINLATELDIGPQIRNDQQPITGRLLYVPTGSFTSAIPGVALA